MIQKVFEEACRIAQRKGEISRAVEVFGRDLSSISSAVVVFKQKDTGVEVSATLSQDIASNLVMELAREQQDLERRFSNL